MRAEVVVVLRTSASASRAAPEVTGEVRSDVGRREFAGWLELFGALEATVDDLCEQDLDDREPAQIAKSSPG